MPTENIGTLDPVIDNPDDSTTLPRIRITGSLVRMSRSSGALSRAGSSHRDSSNRQDATSVNDSTRNGDNIIKVIPKKGIKYDEDYKNRPAVTDHLGKHRQYWRDIILGVNDGLVSTFLLVAGVAGGGLSTSDILLTAISGAIAGAVSMYAGEYVATKSQNEVLQGEIALENTHIQNYQDDEVMELSDMLTLIGIPDVDDEEYANGTGVGDLKQRILSYYEQHPEALLKVMVALEFGVIQEEQRKPCWAGFTSCCLFLLGALPSVIPFAIASDPIGGLIASAIGTALGLFVVGALKTWATRGLWYMAAVENLLIAGAGGGFAYGVGVGFEKVVNS